MKEQVKCSSGSLHLLLVKRAGCFAVLEKLAGLYYGSIKGFLEKGKRSASLEFQESKTKRSHSPLHVTLSCKCRPFKAITACWFAFMAIVNVKD